MSLVTVDLDGLKEINDRGGHLAGDRLLATFASELSAAVRATDVTARVGGDEFLVILPGANADEASAWAERLQARSRSSWSFGVAKRQPEEPFDAWLGRADRSMYAAKPGNRDRDR